MAKVVNKEKKLSTLKKKVSSFPTGLFFFFPPSRSQKYAIKLSEIILTEDLEDIADFFHVNTSQNRLYQLVKVSVSDFFC